MGIRVANLVSRWRNIGKMMPWCYWNHDSVSVEIECAQGVWVTLGVLKWLSVWLWVYIDCVQRKKIFTGSKERNYIPEDCLKGQWWVLSASDVLLSQDLEQTPFFFFLGSQYLLFDNGDGIQGFAHGMYVLYPATDYSSAFLTLKKCLMWKC